MHCTYPQIILLSFPYYLYYKYKFLLNNKYKVNRLLFSIITCIFRYKLIKCEHNLKQYDSIKRISRYHPTRLYFNIIAVKKQEFDL